MNIVSSRKPIIDYLKAICIIFVIINHCSVLATNDPFYLFLIRMAVPCFIMISGYTFSQSYEAKTFSQMYSFTNIRRKVFRYTIPAIITCSLYIILLILSGRAQNFQSCISIFFLGLYGLGAYYYDIMIQFIFIFPIIYIIIKKWDLWGVAFIAFLNLFFELFYNTHYNNSPLYRLLVFRYIFLISLGVYLYMHRHNKLNPYHLIQILCIGIIYLLLPSHLNYSYHIFYHWGDTSMMVGFYVFPILYFIISTGHDFRFSNILEKGLSIIGKSSYHIMYVQMIFFTIKNTVYTYIIDISQFGTIVEVLFKLYPLSRTFLKLEFPIVGHLSFA